MSKELEEIKCIVAIYFGALGILNPSENEQILKDRDKVLNALQRLEAIDKAEPSEAFERLNALCNYQITNKNKDNYEYIKQYILKAQEQEKVLEIIKNKQVNVRRAIILRKDYQDYLENYGFIMAHCEQILSQEEFDLLKRWLENDNDI